MKWMYYESEDGCPREITLQQLKEYFENNSGLQEQKKQGTNFNSWLDEMEHMQILNKECAKMKKYYVIEDNGGGLTLVIFSNEENDIEYIHTGYECNPGQLSEDLQALKNGDNPATDWDGNELNSIEGMENSKDLESWFPYEQKGTGWEIVADNNGTYPEAMGTAARLEFGIK